MICDEADVDVSELISLANRHPRVNVLQPGVGVRALYSGDPWFIVSQHPEQARLVRLARERNLEKRLGVCQNTRLDSAYRDGDQ